MTEKRATKKFVRGKAFSFNGWIYDKQTREELCKTPDGAVVDDEGYFIRWERSLYSILADGIKEANSLKAHAVEHMLDMANKQTVVIDSIKFTILCHSYGAFGAPKLTQKEIAALMVMPRELVAWHKAQAIRILKETTATEDIKK